MNRTTNQDLDSAIARINQLIPQKTFSYYKAQNHYYVATAIDGRRHISAKTKQALYDQLWAFIEGLEILKTIESN
jgi:hypothetical protein